MSRLFEKIGICVETEGKNSLGELRDRKVGYWSDLYNQFVPITNVGMMYGIRKRSPNYGKMTREQIIWDQIIFG